jgi:SAM-dependent methyltransferase
VDANNRQQPRARSHPGPGPVRDRPLEHRGARVDYDAELRLHDEVLRRTYDIRADDRVLDIGCGTGRTTRDAARSAGEGSALGVDLSASMIERARELARAERVHNVAFEHGDAQVLHFPEDGFALAISRSGRCSSMTPSPGDDGLAGARAQRMVRGDRAGARPSP